MNILVVAAHPDDEVLGCGGTIARMVNEGAEVSVLFLSDGVTSRYSQPEEAPQSKVTGRIKMAREAAAVLGIQHVEFRSFPDNRFDSVPLLEIAREVESVVEESRPEILLTHHAGDLNVDHGQTSRAVATAVRGRHDGFVKRVLAFEVPSSTMQGLRTSGPPFVPTYFVDVSDTLAVKLEAMRRYDSETRPYPHPRSERALEALAVVRGSTCGIAAAEAFELMREVVRL